MSPHRCKHLQTLHPAYFALVMATGIVSIAFKFQGYPTIARALLFLNVFQYLVLASLFIARTAFFTKNVLKDLGDHLRGPGFFTVVAGTGVLGAQFFVVGQLPMVGASLGILTILLWMVILYTVFALLIVKEDKPPFEKGINGGWLVAIVATQSVAIVCFFMGSTGVSSHLFLMGGFVAWCFGVMLYVWIISLIFFRYMFFPFQPNDLSPPYWINMGAVAISTLAGCNLIGASEMHPLLIEMRPFLKGVTFLLWSTATWWIPMLLILGFWRHVIRRFPLGYDPLYWGMVFPLGMYSVCTFRLAQELELHDLFPLSTLFLFLGSFVWLCVFLGMLKRIYSIRVECLAENRLAAAEGGGG